ncbi:MAG: hypothetical protein LBQ89_09245 [Treponema sp.]|jgi:hypothetical protein|nr:hypothetical protein [Treponema sp.]
MNIGNIPYHAFPSVGYAMSAARDGRMSIPVSPSQLIYSHFEHVSGTPAPEGTRGVNISKLKIINTLIDQLEKMKKQTPVNTGALDENDEERINALINQYQKQIKTAQSVKIYTPAVPAAGALFSLTA